MDVNSITNGFVTLFHWFYGLGFLCDDSGIEQTPPPSGWTPLDHIYSVSPSDDDAFRGSDQKLVFFVCVYLDTGNYHPVLHNFYSVLNFIVECE